MDADGRPTSALRLNIRGRAFEVPRETMLRFSDTYFSALLSGRWQPDRDGAYFIDRPSEGFDRILEYLRSGRLRLEGADGYEERCVYDTLEYLLIPHTYRKRWDYSSNRLLRNLTLVGMCELADGRLCGGDGSVVVVYSMQSNAVEARLEGHTDIVYNTMQLADGRVCSCSNDKSIRVWDLSTGKAELTLLGHARSVSCVAQLRDGRLCSSSFDRTVRVWDLSDGLCVLALTVTDTVALRPPSSIVELRDGRLAIGYYKAGISIWNLHSGECDARLAYEGMIAVSVVVVDATRICSSAEDGVITVWNTDTGAVEQSLRGDCGIVFSLALMHDGRLCSSAGDGGLRIWDLDSGRCVQRMDCFACFLTGTASRCFQVLQLADGRLACTYGEAGVRVWGKDPSDWGYCTVA